MKGHWIFKSLFFLDYLLMESNVTERKIIVDFMLSFVWYVCGSAEKLHKDM
jgi:hypothetical protein